MEQTRELDRLRAELDKLHDRANDTTAAIATIETRTAAQHSQIMSTLSAIKADMDTMREAVASLQFLATKGETSLKTFLWMGGTLAALTSFVLMLYSYLPK